MSQRLPVIYFPVRKKPTEFYPNYTKGRLYISKQGITLGISEEKKQVYSLHHGVLVNSTEHKTYKDAIHDIEDGDIYAAINKRFDLFSPKYVNAYAELLKKRGDTGYYYDEDSFKDHSFDDK